jgi:hypothetical protein
MSFTAFPGSRLLTTTLTNVIPLSVGLAGCVVYFGRRYPDWLLGGCERGLGIA